LREKTGLNKGHICCASGGKADIFGEVFFFCAGEKVVWYPTKKRRGGGKKNGGFFIKGGMQHTTRGAAFENPH